MARSTPLAGQHSVHYCDENDTEQRWYCGRGSGSRSSRRVIDMPMCEECIVPDAPERAAMRRANENATPDSPAPDTRTGSRQEADRG